MQQFFCKFSIVFAQKVNSDIKCLLFNILTYCGSFKSVITLKKIFKLTKKSYDLLFIVGKIILDMNDRIQKVVVCVELSGTKRFVFSKTPLNYISRR